MKRYASGRIIPRPSLSFAGGQGPDEWISEAQAMHDYLVAHGISSERILQEDQSTSTYENLSFAISRFDLSGVASGDRHEFLSPLSFGQNGSSAWTGGIWIWNLSATSDQSGVLYPRVFCLPQGQKSKAKSKKDPGQGL